MPDRRNADPELSALSRIVRILDRLTMAERDRVLEFLVDRYELAQLDAAVGEAKQ